MAVHSTLLLTIYEGRRRFRVLHVRTCISSASSSLLNQANCLRIINDRVGSEPCTYENILRPVTYCGVKEPNEEQGVSGTTYSCLSKNLACVRFLPNPPTSVPRIWRTNCEGQGRFPQRGQKRPSRKQWWRCGKIPFNITTTRGNQAES